MPECVLHSVYEWQLQGPPHGKGTLIPLPQGGIVAGKLDRIELQVIHFHKGLGTSQFSGKIRFTYYEHLFLDTWESLESDRDSHVSGNKCS